MKQKDNTVKSHQLLFIISAIIVCFLVMVYFCEI
jgi:hypothetical protein